MTDDELKVLKALFEPESCALREPPLASIAISLKRIADHLAPKDGVHQPPLLWLGDVLRAISRDR